MLTAVIEFYKNNYKKWRIFRKFMFLCMSKKKVLRIRNAKVEKIPKGCIYTRAREVFHRHCISDIFPWKSCKSRDLTNKQRVQSLHYGLR